MAGQGWFDRIFGDLARQFRWSLLPPLMAYFAAGISGLTAIAAEIAKLHGEGKTVTEIAREIGISRGSVYNHLRA